MTTRANMDFSLDEDALIQGLLDAKGKRVEIIAFGLAYTGLLEKIDIDRGTVVVVDGEDSATLEIERIESLFIQGER